MDPLSDPIKSLARAIYGQAWLDKGAPAEAVDAWLDMGIDNRPANPFLLFWSEAALLIPAHPVRKAALNGFTL